MEENLPAIDWEKTLLLPAIAQDAETKEVLMLAYMNREALERTLASGYAHYYSRSRKRLWKKGESSGHVQRVRRVLLDCDGDTLLIQVDQEGVACHTGRKSCFFTDLQSGTAIFEPQVDPTSVYGIVDTLYHTVLERKSADPSTSWTAQLFHKGENAILKKVVEEAGEFCFAIKDNDEAATIYECADLVYHALVALGYRNIAPDRIRQELARRSGTGGITEKNSRKQ